MLVGAIWAYFLLRRHRAKKQQTEKGDDYHHHSSWSTNGKLSRLPFYGSAAAALKSGRQQQHHRGIISTPFASTKLSTNASIMDQALRSNSNDDDIEPMLLRNAAAAVSTQASIRQSLVSWFHRSSGHHPLQLNPMVSSSSSDEDNKTMPSPGVNDMFFTMAGVRESTMAPPVMDRIVSSSTATPEAPSLVAPPEPAFFSRDEAQAYCNRHWAGARSSRASSVTTMRTTVTSGGGLSLPPTYSVGRWMDHVDDYYANTSVGRSEEEGGGETARNLPQDVLDLKL